MYNIGTVWSIAWQPYNHQDNNVAINNHHFLNLIVIIIFNQAHTHINIVSIDIVRPFQQLDSSSIIYAININNYMLLFAYTHIHTHNKNKLKSHTSEHHRMAL